MCLPIQTYIKDTNHALNIFSQVLLPTNQPIHLFLLDVTSLYTSIPHADGLTAVKHFLNTRTSPVVSTDTLVRLTELVLTLNSFEFSGEFFDQISGVAMGTKMGPSYACLFMGYLEWQMVNRYQGPTPEFYYRYIDDGIGISTMPLDDLKNYIDFVKTFHPSISFTSEISTSTVNFWTPKFLSGIDFCTRQSTTNRRIATPI
ncbi:telomerase reverse transcriptase [Elysia marginata]|uniref:Telomerase reverse transcriptase n=1 Tax=Elysia marginata TaxID=1093978 RepID=A0AAV4FDK3_9GAST|nr:telomerase reverse transcriptase [Elysia marginata]